MNNTAHLLGELSYSKDFDGEIDALNFKDQSAMIVIEPN